MRSRALLIALMLTLLVLHPLLSLAQDVGLEESFPAIQSFGVTAPGSGWLLAGGRLFVHDSEQAGWREVTPGLPQTALILAVDFAGETGWAVAAVGETPDRLLLAKTTNRGGDWSVQELEPYGRPQDVPPTGDIFIDFMDATYGWLTVKHLTSANFSTGDLFATTDGGATWEHRSLPIGDPVHFVSPLEGYVQGGATGAESYRTVDGGRIWQPSAEAMGVRAAGVEVEWAGARSPGTGWRIETSGRCVPERDQIACEVAQLLLQTTDGGATWTEVPLPELHARGRSPRSDQGPRAIAPAGQDSLLLAHTELVIGHGFDKCEVATIPELEDWYESSPYRVVNIYFGGNSRACSNAALTASYLRAIETIGWRFIPTWVGPQAPCYAPTSKSKMSGTPETAYTQGIAEANSASDRLSSLGLADSGGGGVAYYDLEYYPYAADCEAAVKRFVAGWSGQMRARGNLAGLYSTSGILGRMASAQQVPDVVWPANWYPTATPPATPRAFDPNASVWNLWGLSNDLWKNHQRIRQYNGGHRETWGATTLNIDNDVLDGVVGSVRLTPTPTSTPSNTPTPWTPDAWTYLPLLFD